MTLGEVLADVEWRGDALRTLAPIAGRTIAGLDYDSRRIQKDFLFFAFPGVHVDGRKFAEAALRQGALAVVSELTAPSDFTGPWLQVAHGRTALAAASRAFYRQPDLKVFFTGITGTNGKTTTAYLADAMLTSAGNITGMIGTIEYRMAGDVRPAPNTTPESLDVMRFASELAERRGKHLVSEVSSHALALGRVSGFHFHTAVFTNLTRDHLDFHETMESYRDAKALLFRPPSGSGPAWAVLNAEDPASAAMRPTGDAQVIEYGTAQSASLRALNVSSSFEGLQFDLTWQGKQQHIASGLTGDVNVLNILAAAGIGLSYGMELGAIAEGIAKCRAVPGRFERVNAGQPFLVVVDYAHTDDALRNAIRMARKVARGRVITLFGCGGDRDRTKRPLMGMAAGELSDFVVLTSDNPRSEEPLAIMNDAMVGLGRFDTPHVAEPDRAKGIQLAIAEAKPGDVVLIAGKGHETYQVLNTGAIHFDDREVARAVLASQGYAG